MLFSSPFLPERVQRFLELKEQFLTLYQKCGEAFSLSGRALPEKRRAYLEHLRAVLEELDSLREELALCHQAHDVRELLQDPLTPGPTPARSTGPLWCFTTGARAAPASRTFS